MKAPRLKPHVSRTQPGDEQRARNCVSMYVANFSTYREADADEMTGLLGEVFARRDPPAVAVG
jgi:hypothetical protein